MASEYSDIGRGLDDIFFREIKDKIDSAWRLQRQLERCNILAAQATDDYRIESFKNSVDMAIGDLPQYIKRAVEAREEEYTIVLDPQPRFIYNCNVRVGSAEKPVKDEEGNIISPVMVEVPPEVDYVKKLEIIKEELETGGASWAYKKALKESGKVPRELPAPIISEHEASLKQVVMKHRAEGQLYSWTELLDALRKLTPELPILQPATAEDKQEDESSAE